MSISIRVCGPLAFGVLLSAIMLVAGLHGLRTGEASIWTIHGPRTLRGDRARRFGILLLVLTSLTFSAFVILPILDGLMN